MGQINTGSAAGLSIESQVSVYCILLELLLEMMTNTNSRGSISSVCILLSKLNLECQIFYVIFHRTQSLRIILLTVTDSDSLCD